MAEPAEPAQLGLPDFLELYPWPEDLLEQGRPLQWLWDYGLAASAEALWPHLIETSRFNRALGLSQMHFEERDGELHGWSINGGFRQEWVEDPWTWVTGRSFIGTRRYTRGFAHVVRVIYHLEPGADGSRLHVYMGFIPRSAFGRLALRIGVPPIRSAYRKVLDQICEEVGTAREGAATDAPPRPAVYHTPADDLSEDATRRVGEIGARLREGGADPAAAQKLVEHIERGDPMDLYRVQPRRLAREWDISESALLTACLHATRLGLLQMSWDVICPHCRGVRSEEDSLSAVTARAACEVCAVDFATDAESSIEVTFHVHPSIREVPKLYYCSAEPATKAHIKVQQRLAAGERRAVTCRLPPGRYRLRLKGERQPAGLLTARGEGDERLEWSAGTEIGDREVGAELSLDLANPSDEERLFLVEDVRWSDDALRPSRLFSFQEFRDLFSEEYLSADVHLNVGEQTILFTDMVESTRFYRRLGDPAAFVRVKDHFSEVFRIIADRGGAVVKTIGDAVMAAFPDPLGAVGAACAMHRAFPARDGEPDPICLRISINTGPCIAVNLNTGVDYFGGTVNVAAKLQACAEGGEVAISRRVYESPGVKGFLEDEALATESGSYEHPALEPVDYVRFAVPDPVTKREAAPPAADSQSGGGTR